MQRVGLRSLVRKLGSQMPPGSNNQNITQETIVTNSIKALTMVHIKKKSLKSSKTRAARWCSNPIPRPVSRRRTTGRDTRTLVLCGTVVRKDVFIWLPQTFVMAQGTLSLHCSMWDLAPWPGIRSGPSASGAQSLSPWTTRKPYCNTINSCQGGSTKVSTSRWMDKDKASGILLAHEQIMPFAATWKDLERMLLSGVSHTEKGKCEIPLIGWM